MNIKKLLISLLFLDEDKILKNLNGIKCGEEEIYPNKNLEEMENKFLNIPEYAYGKKTRFSFTFL